MPGVDIGCTTHWMACPCREARAAGMEAALREILAIQGEIMPGWNDEYIKASWVRRIAEKALGPYTTGPGGGAG